MDQFLADLFECLHHIAAASQDLIYIVQVDCQDFYYRKGKQRQGTVF